MDLNVNFSLHFPISPIVPLLSLVVVADLLLAWRTWRSNIRNPVNIFYGLAVFTAALWTTVNLLAWWVVTKPSLVSLLARMGYVFGTLIVFFFYFFTHFFPYTISSLSKKRLAVILIITIMTLVLSIMPNFLVGREVYPETVNKISYSLFWATVYHVFFLGMVFLSYRNLFNKYKIADGIWRVRLRQVIIATGAAFFGGVFFTLTLPVFFRTYKLYWLGFPFSLFMAVYIWYHIFWKPNRIPTRL